MAFSTNTLEAGTILAVVEGGVDQNFRLGTLPVCAGDDQVSFIEVSVTEDAAWAFLCFAIQLSCDFNGASVGKVGWWGDVFRKGRGGVKKSLHRRPGCWLNW